MGCPALALDVPRAKRLPGAVCAAARRLPDELRYRPDVLELVLRWPELRAFIAEAVGELLRYFAESSEVFLDRFDDPESEEEDPILYLVVRTSLKAGQARVALERFHEEWWTANEDRNEDRLFVSVEFR